MSNKKSDPIDTDLIDVESIDETSSSAINTDITPPKKRNIWLIVIISVLAAAILAAGTTFAFSVFFKDDAKAPNVSKETPPQTNDEDSLSAKKLVAEAVAGLAGVKNAPEDNKGSASYPVFAAPVFKPSGYEFSVRPSEDYGLFSTGNKDVATSDLSKVKTVLRENNLKETVLQAGDDRSMFTANYESDNIICVLSDQKPFEQTSGSEDYSVSLGCADKVAYNDNAKVLKPYFDVYKVQSEYDTSKLALNTPVITQSPVDGYSRATVGIGGSEYDAVGGFAGLFYSTPDGKLHFFKGTQSQIPCEDFDTDDIRKAFAGESCYDVTDDQAVVKAN